MKNHIFILTLLLASSSIYARPLIYDAEKASIAFTMWDVRSDLSYVIDLDINLLDFSEKPAAFEFDIPALIEKKTEVTITDVENFRWSVVGGIDGESFDTMGYLGSYDNGTQPSAENLGWIRQRTKRLNYYFAEGKYSAGPNEISVRSTDSRFGHYRTGWQGNFNGLSQQDMESKGGQGPMILWSFIASDWNKFEKKKLGEVTLTKQGMLSFKPINE